MFFSLFLPTQSQIFLSFLPSSIVTSIFDQFCLFSFPNFFLSFHTNISMRKLHHRHLMNRLILCHFSKREQRGATCYQHPLKSENTISHKQQPGHFLLENMNAFHNPGFFLSFQPFTTHFYVERNLFQAFTPSRDFPLGIYNLLFLSKHQNSN